MILIGDATEKLKTLADASVHCCVTSPPYYGLRDYGVASQIGKEKSPDEYIARMVEVFREVRRVLRDDGTLWLNLGDSYGGYHGNKNAEYDKAPSNKPGYFENQRVSQGGKAKQLMGIPWRVAFALQDDGWVLRQDIIWNKPNPMPESVRDRCTKSHEYLFLFAKRQRYYFDQEAIKVPIKNTSAARDKDGNPLCGVMANKKSVWTITTKPYKGAHFATFPPDLIEPCILAGSPVGGTVLDPFGGSGTTGQVSRQLDRKFILIELNPAYETLIRKRLQPDIQMKFA